MATLRKRNDKWQAQVRRTGHPLRTKTFLIRADALRWIRRTELELDRAPIGFDPRTLERTTVADLLRRYRKEITPSKRGNASEGKRLEVFLRERWAALSVARATSQTFTQYRDKRLRQVEAGTVIRELGLLQSVFETARREWDIPLAGNPLAKVRKPKPAAGRTRRLQANELQALLRACIDARSGWLKPGILLALETGMRRGEILNIRSGDLDLAARLLTIPETKTDTPRTIPLSSLAVELLRPLAKATSTGSARLFPTTANAFKLAWQRCRQRAAVALPSIADLRFHDLRHEAVSRFFELGLSVPEVAAISGHKDPRMLFRYTHLKPQDLVAKLQALETKEAA